jgi:16S rRNA (cytidine1402-2'-O)-methyltransferase
MPEAQVAVIREATKVHEEVIRGSAAELAARQCRWRGEFVIGICNKIKHRPAEESEK